MTGKDDSPGHKAHSMKGSVPDREITLSTLLGNLPGMAYRCRNDREYTMEFVSEGCLDLTGYQPDDFIHNKKISYNEIILEEHRREVWEEIQNCLRFNKPFRMEYRIRTSGNTVKWVWEQGCGIYSPSGEVLALEGFITDITERRQAEEARDRTGKEFHDIVHNASIGIFRSNSEGKFLLMNKALASMFGYESPEAALNAIHDIGRQVYAEPGKRSEITELIKKHGEQVVYETRFKKKDGKEWTGLMHIRTEFDPAGNPLYYEGFIKDITDRKIAEEKIQEQKEILESTNRELNETIIKLEAANRELAAANRELLSQSESIRLNEARLDVLKRLGEMADTPLKELMDFVLEEAVELTGSSIGYLAFVSPDEKTMVMYSWSRTAMEECRISDKPLEYPLDTTGLWGEAVRQRRPVITNEYSAPSSLKKGYPDGHVHLERHLNVPVFEGDRIVIVAGVGNKTQPYDESDVRQLTLLMNSMWRIIRQKQSEEALRQSEIKFRAIIEQSSEGFLLADETGIVIEWNRAMERLSGVKRRNVIGKPFDEVQLNLLPPEHRTARRHEVFRDALKEALSTGESRYFHQLIEGRILRPDNESVYFQQTIFPIRTDTGFRLGSVTRDISAQKRAEEDSIRLEEQVRHAQRMESLGRLAGGVAHDFNNMLTLISGNIELALMRIKPNDPLRDILRAVERAAESAHLLVERLLAFSRKQPIEPRILNLNDLICDLNAMLLRLAGPEINLSFSLNPGLGPVKVDKGQVEQVIINLVMNARDAMEDGGELSLETSDVEFSEADCAGNADFRPGRYIMLQIRDSGSGMSEEVKRHLFEPFFTTKPEGKGTGLGLSTVYGSIKQNGGFIEVVSETGKGSTFKIYLPLHAEEQR